MRPRSHKRTWQKQRVSSGPDALLFFLAFAIGIGGIVWLKRVGLDQLVVTAVPCAVLLLYAATVKFVPLFRLREDQAGDNCYYLGFLFTLVSLSLALIDFVQEGGTETIVESFGIALASTILGLALRVAFNQMRQDPVEVEREARLELAGATQRLRAELDQSVTEMNAFRRATTQSITDGLQELNAKIGELIEGNLERYDEVTRGSAERIEQTLSAFAENAQSLNAVAEQTAAAIETLTTRIEAIKTPENLVEAKLAPATDAIAEMVGELQQRAGAESKEFRQLRKLIDGASATALGLETRIEAVAEALSGLERLTGQLATTESHLEKLNAGLDQVGNALGGKEESVAASLKQGSESIAIVSEELRQTLSEPARETAASLKSIAAQAESLRETEAQLKRLSEAMKEQVSALSTLREETQNAGLFSFLRR